MRNFMFWVKTKRYNAEKRKWIEKHPIFFSHGIRRFRFSWIEVKRGKHVVFSCHPAIKWCSMYRDFRNWCLVIYSWFRDFCTSYIQQSNDQWSFFGLCRWTHWLVTNNWQRYCVYHSEFNVPTPSVFLVDS